MDTTYPFQRRVTEHILAGRSVVLQAPTGAGKTRAALTPYLIARRDSAYGTTPPKCLYAVPMRVLAAQFYEEQVDKLRQKIGLERLKVTRQTGDAPEDPQLEGDLIFLTIDQLLSSFLTMPYSVSRRKANVNAGAVAEAYLVMDEFHLFDPESTLRTTLEMLRRLRGLVPFVLMTATFTQTMLHELADWLQAEVVTTPPAEVQAIETRWATKPARQRTWYTVEAPLTAEAVLAHRGRRTLVMCNQVRRAQELCEAVQVRHGRVILLHSRFLPEDRKRWEDELRVAFHEGSQEEIIAVTTQIAEVGLDISADVLHSDLAPASALIQRAGRCARYPGESGQVYVYPVESYRPYSTKADDAAEEEMQAAFAWLRERGGQPLDFSGEQELVDTVCAARDRAVLDGLSAGRVTRSQQVNKALRGHEDVRGSLDLVRDAESRRLLVHDQPDELLADPFGATGFSLHPSVLCGSFQGWQERAGQVPWVAMRLDEAEDIEQTNRPRREWRPIADLKDLRGATHIVVHPKLVGYAAERGLLLEGGPAFRSQLPNRGKPFTETTRQGGYRLESYVEHIGQVIGEFERVALSELREPAATLERQARWRPGSLLQAAWLVCALHDVGKLSDAWQNWVRQYQMRIGEPIPAGFIAAHTHLDRQRPDHLEAQKAVARLKATHAGEGEVAVMPLLAQAIDRNEALLRAALSAIGRHHTPFLDTFGTYRLGSWAVEQVQATLEQLPPEARRGVNPRALRMSGEPKKGTPLDTEARPEQFYEWWAYALLARALRRADQLGTKAGAQSI